MRILLFDSNRAFAALLKAFARDHLKNVDIDYADNVFILRDRCHREKYDLILADADFDVFSGKVDEVLSGVSTPIVYWSLTPKSETIRKPCTDDELSLFVSAFPSFSKAGVAVG